MITGIKGRYAERDSLLLKVILYVFLVTVTPYYFTTLVFIFICLIYFYEVEYKNLTILRVKWSKEGYLEKYDRGDIPKETLEEKYGLYKNLLKTTDKGKEIKTEKYNSIINDIKYTGNYGHYKVSILKKLREVTYIPFKDIALIYRDKRKVYERVILIFITLLGFVASVIYLKLDLTYVDRVSAGITELEVKKLDLEHKVWFFFTILNILNVKFILVDKYLERRQEEILTKTIKGVLEEYEKRLK